MNNRNYQKELEQVILGHSSKSRVPRLLLHSCCAPCSSYVLEYLSQYFAITVFYYNPNIFPEEEHRLRGEEQRRLIESMTPKYPIRLILGQYEPERFLEIAKGLEREPEGGERCRQCFHLRLEETARMAAEGGFDYFTTSLTISPLKSSATLNEIGEAVGMHYQVSHLPSDFKKKNGYKRSVELSREHGLYRQDYCGCVYSKAEQEGRKRGI